MWPTRCFLDEFILKLKPIRSVTSSIRTPEDTVRTLAMFGLLTGGDTQVVGTVREQLAEEGETQTPSFRRRRERASTRAAARSRLCTN